MNDFVSDADLYVTMHTGVWIMLYPWGKWASQPSDWELFYGIREEVHANISDIPIQNANQGLYPNCGTSRDYGYGVMGFPTFTFETDDEQFVPGSVEALNERLAEEMDVMRYLITNVWYWRARLDVQSIQITDADVIIDVDNLGMASTTNASLQFVNSNGEVTWTSSLFSVNATNSTIATLDATNLSYSDSGSWQLYYQKRVIDASKWVTEPLEINATSIDKENSGSFLVGYGLFSPTTILVGLAVISLLRKEEPEAP